jgi:hypothetical protein
MPEIFDRIIVLNLVANTLIFYVAARLYLLPLIPRVRPQQIRLRFRQADSVGIQYFRHGRSARRNYDRDDLQRADRDGTSLLDTSGGGAAIIGGSLRDFCSSPAPLGKLSRLKILLWEDVHERVWITYNSPIYLQKRRNIPPELLQNIAVNRTIGEEGGGNSGTSH